MCIFLRKLIEMCISVVLAVSFLQGGRKRYGMSGFAPFGCVGLITILIVVG